MMSERNFAEQEEDELHKQMVITKVIEYVHPVMAKELMCKFPDNSAYDFDYTQSSIWSPLVTRRACNPIDLDFMVMKPRKLSFDHMGMFENKKLSFKKVASSIEKKITATAFNMSFSVMMKAKKKIKGSDDCELSSKPPQKGWSKVLKAASRNFKRKKRDPRVHVKLSS